MRALAGGDASALCPKERQLKVLFKRGGGEVTSEQRKWLAIVAVFIYGEHTLSLSTKTQDLYRVERFTCPHAVSR